VSSTTSLILTQPVGPDYGTARVKDVLHER
jgi:hypothetical protein